MKFLLSLASALWLIPGLLGDAPASNNNDIKGPVIGIDLGTTYS